MKRALLSLVIIACACTYAHAQGNVQQPDLQTADSRFFDPTRQVAKDTSYQFSVEYRIETGFIQNYQWSRNDNYPNMFLHGARIGATFDFVLPLHFTMQTGLFLDMAYGKNEQHWRSQDAPSVQQEYLQHRIFEFNMVIPVRMYYTIPLWKQLNMFFFTGPQLGIGLTEHDFMVNHLSEKTNAWVQSQGYQTSEYDRLSKEVSRVNIQWALGTGLEWDRYRVQAGYQFGLNNMARKKVVKDQHLWEWGWFLSFCYKF